jgi:hypothetical protein
VLDYAGVAAFLGVSRSWVEKHIADLPPRRSFAGTPRWLKSSWRSGSETARNTAPDKFSLAYCSMIVLQYHV